MKQHSLHRVVLTLTAIAAVTAHAPRSIAAGDPQSGRTSREQATDAVSPTFRMYGAFHEMMAKRDFSKRVRLGEVVASGATHALGALSGLRGEVTMMDGRLLLSCGSGQRCGPSAEETAALLATARVEAWSPPISFPADMRGREVDAFILEQADRLGVSTQQPFVVRIQGSLLGVRMHVLAGPDADSRGHATGHAMARQDVQSHSQLAATDVVGFFAPEALRGIATHPGEPFHYHWIDAQRSQTSHLDEFGVAAGAQVRLSVR